MENETSVFNGSENGLQDSKYLAVHQFYNAFNNRNLELMQANWSHSEFIRMANPIGGIRKGWLEILEGYKKIFSSNHKVFVELFDFQFISSDKMFVITGRERGHLEAEGKKLDLRIRTTRIYHLEGAKWKQVTHHGSIDEPKLLDEYQKIILKK